MILAIFTWRVKINGLLTMKNQFNQNKWQRHMLNEGAHYTKNIDIYYIFQISINHKPTLFSTSSVRFIMLLVISFNLSC